MTTAEVLQKARGLYFRAPSHAAEGDIPRPGTFCVVLALDEALRSDRSGGSECSFNEALAAFESAIGSTNVVRFNAEHSTGEVLAAFSAAARNAS